jgi:hypothetical protein
MPENPQAVLDRPTTTTIAAAVHRQFAFANIRLPDRQEFAVARNPEYSRRKNAESRAECRK